MAWPRSKLTAWLKNLASALRLRGSCPSSDDWWGDSTTCVIPGFLGGFPANYDSYQVCGGNTGIQKLPIADGLGTRYGTMHLFRDYSDQLHVTVTLDGFVDSQYFFVNPNQGAPQSSSLYIWDGPAVPPGVQYPSPVALGSFTCYSYVVDLKHVCDPDTSYYRFSTIDNGNYNCMCKDNSKACPTKDLSKSGLLFFRLQANLTQRDLSRGSLGDCGQATGKYATDFVQAEGCVSLIISTIPFFTGRAEEFLCSVEHNPGMDIESVVEYKLNFKADFHTSFFNMSLNEFFWRNIFSSLQVGCGAYAVYDSSDFNSMYHVCIIDFLYMVDIVPLNQWSCSGATNQLLQASATLASVEDSDEFIRMAQDQNNARRIATANNFNLGCGDSLLFDATPCGGPSARVSWDSDSLPALACPPPPARNPPALPPPS
eukprot:gene21480-28454_t